MKNQSVLYYLDLQLFAEDPNTQDDTSEVDPEKNYAETLKEIKKNTVPKSAYEKLEAQNKQLLDAIINGSSEENQNQQTVKVSPDLQKLRKELFNQDCNLTNLEFTKKALELRKGIMDEGGIDPFVPVGEKIIPEESDFTAAQRVADVLQECVDACNGDSGVFTNLLQLKTIEVMPNVSKRGVKA